MAISAPCRNRNAESTVNGSMTSPYRSTQYTRAHRHRTSAVRAGAIIIWLGTFVGISGCRSVDPALPVIVGEPRAAAGSPLPIESAEEEAVRRVRRSARATVRVDLTEAEALLRILEARRTSGAIADALWDRLWASPGYRRLAARERDMGLAFSDSAFRAFVLSDSLRVREHELARAVAMWRELEISEPSERAAAYLPPGTQLRATLYPVIKPARNSFVYDLSNDPAFFIYMDPAVASAALENTLAHELHHVGLAAACSSANAARSATFARRMELGGADSVAAARLAVALNWMSAFGEGLAMLAAAGGPDVHPHAMSADSDRVRWDRDVAQVPSDLPRLERFFTDVLDGRLTDPAAIRREAFGFFGVQGPWYTVGYVMARTVEVSGGRAQLLVVACDPAAWLTVYNAAAARENARGPNGTSGTPRLPIWSPAFLARLGPDQSPPSSR